MHKKTQFATSCLLAAALAVSVAGTACAHHYYDPYYSDYHTWNNGEVFITSSGRGRPIAMRIAISANCLLMTKRSTGSAA
jgi:hypothetical protein